MFSSGWRNIVIDSETKLNYENHNFSLSKKSPQRVAFLHKMW